MNKKLATIAAAAAPAVSALAEGENAYTVPQGVQTAIDELSTASSGLASAVAPALGDIVLAFIGIAALLWVGRFLWRKAQGRS